VSSFWFVQTLGCSLLMLQISITAWGVTARVTACAVDPEEPTPSILYASCDNGQVIAFDLYAGSVVWSRSRVARECRGMLVLPRHRILLASSFEAHEVVPLSIADGSTVAKDARVADAGRQAYDPVSDTLYVCTWNNGGDSGGAVSTLKYTSSLSGDRAALETTGVIAAIKSTSTLSRSIAVLIDDAGQAFLIVGSYHKPTLRVYALPACALHITHELPAKTEVWGLAADPGGRALVVVTRRLERKEVLVLEWPLSNTSSEDIASEHHDGVINTL
jgi:hypothetical protein